MRTPAWFLGLALLLPTPVFAGVPAAKPAASPKAAATPAAKKKESGKLTLVQAKFTIVKIPFAIGTTENTDPHIVEVGVDARKQEVILTAKQVGDTTVTIHDAAGKQSTSWAIHVDAP